MKPTYIGRIFLVLLIFSGACDYLDQEVETTLNEQQVIRYYNRAVNHSVALYTALPSGFEYIDEAMMASASDEAEHTFEGSEVHKFNIGSWNAFDNPDRAWDAMFSGIRRANTLLATIDSVDLSPLTLNPTPDNQTKYLQQTAEILRWKHEARLLRAFYYFELVKRYGGVPIITERMDYLTSDYKSIDRNTLSECINFIVDECADAAEGLPLTYTVDGDRGRVTKGAALAVKSRMLLYAASDLFNDPSWAGSYSKPELISLPADDRQAKWQAAADAAKELIDLPGTGYALAPNYRALFNTFNSPEIIFTRRMGSSNTFEITNYPIGFDKGRSGTTPTQDLVDAYEMITGLPILAEGSGYNSQDPYSNRDPRLDMSIITNNSMFKGRSVEIWEGGRDGKGVPLATKTGYYLKKYVNEDLNLLLDATAAQSWHLFRLAEIYLNYAEALNEASPGHADIKTYVDLVRGRAGVNMPALPAGLSQSDMRDRIRNERRVELAFEDHRLWDLRRWMLATNVLNKPVSAMSIKENSGVFEYQPVTLENRVFQPKMYFYPIPKYEMNIMVNWTQNPIWE